MSYELIYRGKFLQQKIIRIPGKIKSLKPVISKNAKVLILGTMPSEVSLQKKQYYANPRNQFWKIIYDVFGKEIEDRYQDRIKFIKKHCIALWDVLKSCERDGNADSKIRDTTPNDFKKFFRKHPPIKSVIFNGKKAQKFYKNQVIVATKNLQYFCLPSTSSANTSMTYREKLGEWMIIKQLVCIKTNDNE